jgi:predicted acylesterase/phospholipase RssA
MIPVLADELGRRSPGAARAPGRGPRRWKKKNRQFLAKPAGARYCFSEIAVLAFRWTGAPTGLNSGQMVRKNVALVLGGGGSAGHAWLIGIIAGLAEAGLDMTEAADLVVGTSAGATAAAHVRSGIPASELLASVLSEPFDRSDRTGNGRHPCRWPRCSSA